MELLINKEVMMDHCCDYGKKVLNTLKTARGQIEGIINMVEDDRYCVDVAKQILAVSALLKKANHLVINNHINTCVKSAIASGDEAQSQEKIEEIMLLLNSYLNK